jgi:hypothetical protein
MERLSGRMHRALRGAPLVALLLATTASQAQGLELTPAWHGRFAGERTTEARLVLVSPVGGEARLRSIGKRGSFELRLRIEGRRPLVAALPLFPGPDGRIRVEATLPDGSRIEDRLHLARQGAPLAVKVPHPSSPDIPVAEAMAMTVQAQALPLTAYGYRSISSLQLPPAVLAELDAQQTAALANYLAACGELRITGASPQLLERVRGAAGCGGRSVTATAPDNIHQAGAGASPSAFGPLVSLLSSDEHSAAVAHPLLPMLPYPFALLALLGVRRLGPWLMLIPAGAALAYGWLLPLTGAGAVATTWAALDAEDARYRFVSRLALSGDGTERPPLRLSADGIRVSSLDAEPVRLSLDAAAGVLEIPFPVNLFQRRHYLIQGSRLSSLQLRGTPDANGIRLVNRGSRPTPAGWLLWRGGTRRVPALPAGASHMLALEGNDPVPLPWTRMERFLEAAYPLQPVLLLPLSETEPGETELPESGWLLVSFKGQPA